MNFKNIDDIINTFNISEKNQSKNFLNFLNKYFPKWNDYQKKQNKKHAKEYIYFDKLNNKKFSIRYKDSDEKKVESIDVYSNSLKIMGEEIRSSKPFLRLKLNRRQNATLFRYYIVDSWDRYKDEYVDANFKVYLSRDYKKEAYSFSYFNSNRSFSSEEELLSYLNKSNLMGLDYQKKTIEPISVNVNNGELIIRLNDEVLGEIKSVNISNLQSLDFQITENSLKVTLPKDWDINNGSYGILLEFRGVLFKLFDGDGWYRPLDERRQFIRKDVNQHFSLYVNTQQIYSILVRSSMIDEAIPIISGSPVELDDYIKFNNNLIVKLQLPDVMEEEIFQYVNSKKNIIKFKRLQIGVYMVEFNSILQNNDIYISYRLASGKYHQKKISTKRLIKKAFDSVSFTKISANFKMIEFILQVSTTNIVNDIHLKIENRGSKEKISVSPVELIQLPGLITECKFKVNIEDFPFSENFNLSGYDSTVYDISLGLSVNNSKIFDNILFRAPYSKDLNEEIFGQFNSKYQYLINPYGTSNKNELSLRTYFLKNDAADFYRHQVNSITYSGKPVAATELPTIVVVESPDRAQDNGLRFFQYLVDNHSSEFNTYYIISENSSDLENLESYTNRIIFYKSKRHFEIMQIADAIIHTNSSFYAFPVNTSFWNKRQLTIKKLFLQHGIIGVRNLARLYGKSPMFTDRFVVSSQREKDIVINQMNYNSHEVALTGLARFDKLLEQSSPERTFSLRKKILIMPSWRKGQDRLTDADFMKTDFFSRLNELINDSKLIQAVCNNDLEINLYLHHNFQKYSHLFKSPVVTIINESKKSVQELLMDHGILITDFSSVALDFALQERKVLYYEIDDEIINDLDELSDFFPGPVYLNKNKLIEDMVYATDNPQLSENEKLKLDNLYQARDLHASDRIYSTLQELLGEAEKSDTAINEVETNILHELTNKKEKHPFIKFFFGIK